jgi:hypothetical protein
LLKQTSTSAQDAALFAEMLSLPNDGRYPAVELTPTTSRRIATRSLRRKMARSPSQAGWPAYTLIN